MLLRPRNESNTDNASLLNKGEKRHSKAGGDVEPKPKRAALTDISKTFSNVLIDSSKKPQDLKPRLRTNFKTLDSVPEVPFADENGIKPIIEKIDPCPDFDFDKECLKDVNSVAEYALDIFNYYKQRQPFFEIGDYLKRQRTLSGDMRAILINWLISVQEQFELNHETLYLAVKIVDLYLDRAAAEVHRGELQLLGGTAIFLASKFDERVAPLIDDILYMCDDNYTASQVIKMELLVFKTVGYDLGVPISYRFLRRFARVIKLEMPPLTLARYILETSLMFYEFVGVKDDLMAAGALLLALRMKNMGDWNSKLVKYSGYTLEEVEPLMYALNHMIIKRGADYERLENIFSKYSHEIFFSVANIPSLEDKYVLDDPIQPPKHLGFH